MILDGGQALFREIRQIYIDSIPNKYKGMQSPGWGYLVYLSDGNVPFFRVSLSPIFSRTGCQKKAVRRELVVRTCQREILSDRVIIQSNLGVLEHTFHRFL